MEIFLRDQSGQSVGTAVQPNNFYFINSMKHNIHNYILHICLLISLTIISCNRDESPISNQYNNPKVVLRTVYCDGQIYTGITISGKYYDPSTGLCCLTFDFSSSLNACWARLEDSIVTQTVNTPLSYYTQILNNKVTFCGDFGPDDIFVLYFKECTGFGSGCMEITLPPNFTC